MTDDEERDLIARLIEITNPTGGDHTPMPWYKRDAGGGPEIADTRGRLIAAFPRIADRDLAIYFSNAHAAIIGLVRKHARAFTFVRDSTSDQALRSFAENQAELCTIYANLFVRMGKPNGNDAPPVPR